MSGNRPEEQVRTPIAHQGWRHVTVLHWRYEPDELARLLPDDLTPDLVGASAALPSDLAGWRALDIGCNAGFYSFELAQRGADVLAIDHDEHYLAQARWAWARLGLESSVEIRLLGVYDLARITESFDRSARPRDLGVRASAARSARGRDGRRHPW